jgi:cytosine deaminase
MVSACALLIRNVRPAGGALLDVLVRDGCILRIAPVLGEPGPDVPVTDGGGALLLPGLVDGHMHIDKSLAGLPWTPHPAGPDRESRIETEKAVRGELPLPVEARAENLVRQVVTLGTTALRTHVDIDPEAGLGNLRAVLQVRERLRGFVDIQIVAFPQSGVMCAPGVADLLDAAMEEGADLVGGLDPIGYDDDLDGQLDVVFGIAGRHGVGVDLHIHDAGATGIEEIAAVISRAEALGMKDMVTISHGFCLGACDDGTFGRLADGMARNGISLATHGGGASPLPPVKRLRAAGVRVFAGNDNIRDTWSPFGNGDMLERAMLTAWRSGFRTDEDLETALDLATHAGAAVLGLPDYGITPGCRADFFTVRAACAAEAVSARPVRGLVVKGGTIVARDGVLVDKKA